jgi:hypothetical protein
MRTSATAFGGVGPPKERLHPEPETVAGRMASGSVEARRCKRWTPGWPIAQNRLAPGRGVAPAGSHLDPGRTAMPLEQAQKSALREKVSTANKHNVDAVTDEVTAALGTLDADDKDYARVQGWLDDLELIRGGGVPGKF